MNMNNESNNQNFNGGMENLNNGSNMMNPNGVPNPTPIPNNQGFAPQNPTPIPNPTPMPEQNVGTGYTENSNPTPIPPVQENINLQPAGMVEQMPAAPQNNVAEPLEATTLNAQTVMNPTPNTMTSPQDNTMNAMNQPVQNMMNNNPIGMSSPNPNNNIGMMGGVPVPPPIPEEPQNKGKKKPINTPLLIILIVVLVAAIGFGVYYFLTASKTTAQPITITPRLTELELGSEIGTDASFYAQITGTASSNCTVDTNLDTTKVGTYEYTVTCAGRSSNKQTIEVKDTTAPQVEVKDVIVVPGTEVVADDFIDTVNDASEVTFTLDDEVDTSTEGEFEVSITASDEYENTTTVTANLVVTAEAPQSYMYCEGAENAETSTNATAQYRFGINSQGTLYNSQKIITYEFADEAEYSAAATEIEEKGSYNGYEGQIFMDDTNYMIIITVDMEESELDTEFNLDTFPTGEADIEGLFETPCEYGDE